MNYKPALRSINRLLTILKKASILDAITPLISTTPLKSQGGLPLSLQNSNIKELNSSDFETNSILDAITPLNHTSALKSQGGLPLNLQNSKIRELRNTPLYRDIVENGCGND
ncbi:hypothetical protein [Microcoleus sp. herbarium14]|uniref:hypothetical protein n=1 Tax=Microcoleus sp. herbarium14 TaxID=3055439 RepID=UPI002FD2D7D4